VLGQSLTRLAQPDRGAPAHRARACSFPGDAAGLGDRLDRGLCRRIRADRRASTRSPLYVFAATRWRGGRPWLVCGLSAACTLGGIWLLFGRLLRLELYPGLLFGGM